MKLIVAIAILVVVAVAIAAVRGVASGTKGQRPQAVDGAYSGLRKLALSTKAVDIGLKPRANEPYAIVMDIDVNGRTATITSFATGDASLYLSSGGGTIGSGQASPEVAAAAKQFVGAAAAYVPSMEKTSNTPLPQAGEVNFYAVTPEGVYGATRNEQELGERKDAFSPLFYAGQEVLTQIRLLQERQDAERQQKN